MGEDGECESGVVAADDSRDSEAAGWCTCDGGRGMGTPGIGHAAAAVSGCCLCGLGLARTPIDVAGEDAAELARRCVGCEYGSADARPIRLSTGRPS